MGHILTLLLGQRALQSGLSRLGDRITLFSQLLEPLAELVGDRIHGQLGYGRVERHHHLQARLPPAVGIDVQASPQRELLAG